MRKVFVITSIVLAAASTGAAATQAMRPAPQVQASDASEQAKKAWFARAVGDILTGPVQAADRGGIVQGRSSGRAK